MCLEVYEPITTPILKTSIYVHATCPALINVAGSNVYTGWVGESKKVEKEKRKVFMVLKTHILLLILAEGEANCWEFPE